jgi:hypothetical protein
MTDLEKYIELVRQIDRYIDARCFYVDADGEEYNCDEMLDMEVWMRKKKAELWPTI